MSDSNIDPTDDDGYLDDGMLVRFTVEFAVYSNEQLYAYCPGFVEAVKAARSVPKGTIRMKQFVSYEYPEVEVPMPPARSDLAK